MEIEGVKLDYIPSRPSVVRNFSSRMVREPSPFNLYRGLGGGTTSDIGVKRGAKVVTECASVESGQTLAESD